MGFEPTTLGSTVRLSLFPSFRINQLQSGYSVEFGYFGQLWKPLATIWLPRLFSTARSTAARTFSHKWSVNWPTVCNRTLQIEQPGTTTPLPPCVMLGGSSTKLSHLCLAIPLSRWREAGLVRHHPCDRRSNNSCLSWT
jgi:hypothetical protein